MLQQWQYAHFSHDCTVANIVEITTVLLIQFNSIAWLVFSTPFLFALPIFLSSFSSHCFNWIYCIIVCPHGKCQYQPATYLQHHFHHYVYTWTINNNSIFEFRSINTTTSLHTNVTAVTEWPLTFQYRIHVHFSFDASISCFDILPRFGISHDTKQLFPK